MPEDDESESCQASKDSVSSSLVESKLDKAVVNLMSFIFNIGLMDRVMAELEYDTDRIPLGKLSNTTVLRGYTILKDLSAIVNTPTSAVPNQTQIEALTNQYYTLIPHAFKRNKKPPLLDHQTIISKEISLLDNLSDMRAANELMNKAKAVQAEKMALVDRQFQSLGMKEMTPLDRQSTEFLELQTYLIKSASGSHLYTAYKLEDVFRIQRNGEFDRFDQNCGNLTSAQSDRRLLWHGSRSTNFGGILSQGLCIGELLDETLSNLTDSLLAPPEAPVNGYMFGKGIYLANVSTKSASMFTSF